MATAKEQIETVVAEPKPVPPKSGAAPDAAVIASDEWGPEAPPDRREFVRFSHLHRALHACMIVSFITLALTGLSLKFSYTGWARFMSRMLGGFQSAGFIHRTAAVIMFGAFITHIVDLFKLKKREYGSWKALILGPNSMLPMKQDRWSSSPP